MEFVQYHPTGLPFTGILITEAARAEGGHLINKDGYRYLQDYDLGKPEPKPVFRSMELGPRDRLSQAFVKEVEKGRTIETPYGQVVHLDLRHLGEQVIESKLPFVRELCLKYQNLDPVTELIPVRPVVHYMMGGIHTDIDGATPLAGLYAAGEAACVSINGANRLGSNSLPELLVFGVRAGRAAADYASRQNGHGATAAIEAQARDERTAARAAARAATARAVSASRPFATRCRRRWRTAPASTDRATRSRARRRRCARCRNARRISPSTITARRSTPSASPRSSCAFMLDVAETIVNAALRREESRGAHQRLDFPSRDDGRFLAHSLTRRAADGECRVEYLPVTITRWPPGERVYGR